MSARKLKLKNLDIVSRFKKKNGKKFMLVKYVQDGSIQYGTLPDSPNVTVEKDTVTIKPTIEQMKRRIKKLQKEAKEHEKQQRKTEKRFERLQQKRKQRIGIKGHVLMLFDVTSIHLETGKTTNTTGRYEITARGRMKNIVEEGHQAIWHKFSVSGWKVIKVELKNVWVNKIPAQLNDVRKVKMYRTTMQYHDMGADNTSYDGNCVPSALLNLFNNPNETNKDKRLRRLTKEKIIEQLGDCPNYSNDLDFGFEEDEPEFRGYTTEQVKHFCKLNKIRMYAIDFKSALFDTNINDNIKFHKSLPALVYMCASSHMYIITDHHKRESIFRKRYVKNARFEEESKKVDNSEFLIDPPEVDHEKVQTVYFTDLNRVHTMFYDLVKEKQIHGSMVKIEDGKVSRFKYEKSLIVFNPDIKTVLDLIERLNTDLDEENQFVFRNQRIHTLANEYYTKNYGHKQGILHPDVEGLFNSNLSKNFSFTEFWFKPRPEQMQDIHSYDMNKHYTSCLQQNNWGWAVPSAMDSIEKFDGEVKLGFYYVETDNYFPLRGNGMYCGELVQECLMDELITKEDIIPSDKLKPDHFKIFC